MTRILVLEKDDCAFCDTAKQAIGAVSGSFDVELSTIGFDSAEGEAIASRHGALFPPVILIDGEFFSYGRISERRLRRELERRTARSRA